MSTQGKMSEDIGQCIHTAKFKKKEDKKKKKEK